MTLVAPCSSSGAGCLHCIVGLPPRPLHRSRLRRQRPGFCVRASQQNRGQDLTDTLKREVEGTSAKGIPAEATRDVISQQERKRPSRKAESTDWISSELTRRFGLAGGLAWTGFLAFGVISEQIKTRLETATENKGTQDVADGQEVSTSSGLRYTDVRVGGGGSIQKGYLMVLELRQAHAAALMQSFSTRVVYQGDNVLSRISSSNGEVYLNTKDSGRPIVATVGGRPFSGGICQGVEEALSTMSVGGIREARIPARLAYGSQGTSINLSGRNKQINIPPNTDLNYRIELQRVSIPPN